MNNYKLVKNTEWKDVEINGEDKEIPIDWNVISIEKSFKVVGGGTPSTSEASFWNGSIPWLGPKEMAKEKTAFIGIGEKNISEAGAKKLGNKKIIKDSVIISTRAPVGYVKFAKNDLYTNQGCHSILPSKIINNKYIFYWLIKNKNILEQNASGTTFKELSSRNLKSIEFSYPSESQQSSIASILSRQESIIQDIESLISKYESRFQYLSDELLSGRLRVKEVDGQTVLYKNPEDNWKEVEINGEMKEIPKDWGVEKIKNLFNCSMGQTILNKDVISILKEKHIPVFSATEEDKYFGYIESSKVRSILKKDDIVIPARGNSIGFCKLMIEESTSTQTTIQLKTLNKISSKIVYYLFKKHKESFFPVNPGTIPQLTVAEVNCIDIIFIKNEEQKNIVYILSEQEELINQQKLLLVKEKQKFDWLLDNLLSGKYLIKE